LSSSASEQESPRKATLGRRFRTALVASAGYWAIRLIGRSVRWESEGLEHLEAIHLSGHQAILTFWHGRIFPATWYWRNRGIVVMTSMNTDGEMIARCIEKHGYGVARGSSSRGGFRALGEMARAIRGARDVAFTIDGPRGPRYVAKQGPAILARKTGAAICCFHISMKGKIQLRSWDLFQIPLPFTRARVFMAPPIWIPEDADEDAVRQYHDWIQEALDELIKSGNRWEKVS
jgi:lysophospholipid acyltransferase (LPLAT)-like uncharacterized protein